RPIRPRLGRGTGFASGGPPRAFPELRRRHPACPELDRPNAIGPEGASNDETAPGRGQPLHHSGPCSPSIEIAVSLVEIGRAEIKVDNKDSSRRQANSCIKLGPEESFRRPRSVIITCPLIRSRDLLATIPI